MSNIKSAKVIHQFEDGPLKIKYNLKNQGTGALILEKGLNSHIIRGTTSLSNTDVIDVFKKLK